MADIESLGVKGTPELIKEYMDEMDSELYSEEESDYSTLAGHIRHEFQRAKDAKRNGGIEQEMFDGLYAFNGENNPTDQARINLEGGSGVFMNITATKCRAASAWIKDILLGKEEPFSIEPTPLPSLDSHLVQVIEEALAKEAEKRMQPPEPVEGEEPQQPAVPGVQEAQESVVELNQLARDIKDAVAEEIMKEAKHGIKSMQTLISDQLVEGEFYEALSDFIDDFTIFPAAIMKGPIVTDKQRLSWVEGKAIVQTDYIFLNKRVSPFDLYVTPETSCPNDGTIIEHMRITPSELYDFLEADIEAGFKSETIMEILDNLGGSSPGAHPDFDDGLESEKDDQEVRGMTTEKKNILHALHFWGPVNAKILTEWGLKDEKLTEANDYKTFDVEAILVDGRVVKCALNDDPLYRRPYYVASWQKRPGAFWGRSLPSLMSDIQRICNATARALANNMGLASGPQISVYVDRLADDADIEAIVPFKIWQLTSDPTGAGGKAINFDQPTSNARELLEVYNQFEVKADEATGIPRFMYGQEKLDGAGQTAAGLSMLLDSATKTIKEAIRHIDEGLIQPRVEFQFYYNMIKNEKPDFSGDVQVIALGSKSLTVKGAAQIRRNEFLQITANPYDMGIIGKQGRADILREIAKDLELTSAIVPNRLVLKKLEDEEKEMAQRAMEIEGEQKIAATKLQVEGQVAMAQGAQQIRSMEAQMEHERGSTSLQLQMEKMMADQQQFMMKMQAEMQKMQATLSQRDMENKRNVAGQLESASMKSGMSPLAKAGSTDAPIQ